MQKNLIKILIEQHDKLRLFLYELEALASKKTPKTQEIIHTQISFKELLDQHLELENTKFYPVLIHKLQENSRTKEIDNLQKIIDSMYAIGQEIENFLTTYTTRESIEHNIPVYRSDLENMTVTLKHRLDFEETTVFLEWEK